MSVGFEDTHGRESPILIQRGDGDGGGYHSMWGAWMFIIFAIIIFAFILVFAFLRRDSNYRHEGNWSEGIAPAIAMGMAARHTNEPGYAYGGEGLSHREHWDIERDSMKEFGEIKKESALLAKDQEIVNAKYFYDQQTQIQQNRHDAAIGFKDSEVQGLKNKDELSKQICEMERRLTEKTQDEVIRSLTSELNVLKTVMYQRFGYGMPFPQCG